mgnify:CR=1 FL=1
MTYSSHDFGRDLFDELNRGYDVVRLARWAMATYLKHSSETDPQLDKEIMRIVAMEEGPEFELTEEQLVELAHRLVG